MNKFKVKIPIPKSYLKEKYSQFLNKEISNAEFSKLVKAEEDGITIDVGFDALDYWIFGYKIE